MKLISTALTNIVSLEQSHHKPMGMYDVVPLSWQYANGLLAESQARMSRGRRFLLFLKHMCLVTLNVDGTGFKIRNQCLVIYRRVDVRMVCLHSTKFYTNNTSLFVFHSLPI